MLVYGLQQRYALGHGPLTLMSLDNLPANGQVLRAAVLRFAQEIDPPLAQLDRSANAVSHAPWWTASCPTPPMAIALP